MKSLIILRQSHLYRLISSIAQYVAIIILISFLFSSLSHSKEKINLYHQCYLLYSYLNDNTYINDGGVRLDQEGNPAVTQHSDIYASTWTYFDPAAIYGVKPDHNQFLRSVPVDGSTFDIDLTPQEIDQLARLKAENPYVVLFGLRTAWTKDPNTGDWTSANTDYMTIEADGLCTIIETLSTTQLQTALTLARDNPGQDFVLNNDIVLPDGRRDTLSISAAKLSSALERANRSPDNQINIKNVYRMSFVARQARDSERGYDVERQLAQKLQSRNLTVYSYLQEMIGFQHFVQCIIWIIELYLFFTCISFIRRDLENLQSFKS